MTELDREDDRRIAPRVAAACAVAAAAALVQGCFVGTARNGEPTRTAASERGAVAPIESRRPVASGQREPEPAVAVAAAPASAPIVAPPPPAPPSPSPAPAPPRSPSLANQVYFDVDAYVVKPEYQRLLEQHAAALKADPRLRVTVQAHADPRGGARYNQALAAKRADVVVRLLESMGVKRSQIETVAHGAVPASVGGTSEASLARSRRVELTYRS